MQYREIMISHSVFLMPYIEIVIIDINIFYRFGMPYVDIKMQYFGII